MQLITKNTILKDLSNRYKSQYPTNIQFFDGSWSDEVLNKFSDETDLTEEKAIEIIGNESWTRNECNECKKDVFATVQIGDEPDYDSNTVNVCLDCLNKAVTLCLD